MEVVADPGEADPERQDDHGELEKGSYDLQDPVADSDRGPLDVRHVVEPGLEVDDQEHSAVEAEAGVSGEEGETGLVKLLDPLLTEVPADDTLRVDELVVSPLVLAQLLRQLGVAEGEVVRPQTSHGVLGQLREEECGEGAQGEVAEVSIKLHGNPGSVVIPDRLDPPGVGLTPDLGIVPDGLHQNDEDDRDGGPDGHADRYRDRLLFVGMLQVLVVTEEAPGNEDNVTVYREGRILPVVRFVLLGKDVDVCHGQDEDDEAQYFQESLAHDLATAGCRTAHLIGL